MLLGKPSIIARRIGVDDDLKLWLPPTDLTGGDKIRSSGYLARLGTWDSGTPRPANPNPRRTSFKEGDGKKGRGKSGEGGVCSKLRTRSACPSTHVWNPKHRRDTALERPYAGRLTVYADKLPSPDSSTALSASCHALSCFRYRLVESLQTRFHDQAPEGSCSLLIPRHQAGPKTRLCTRLNAQGSDGSHLVLLGLELLVAFGGGTCD